VYGYGGVYAYGGAYVGGAYVGGSYPVAGAPWAGAGGYGYGGSFNPGGSCCQARMQPGCQPYPVAQCVCSVEPYCCEKLWDDSCVQLVDRLGCGVCRGVDCQSCLFQSCGFELNQCFLDYGCLSIFTCTQDSGCQAFECYTEGQCRGVIDDWGGPGGYSMGLLLQAFSCAFQSGCPCN
jgi:hypothetical protein